MGQSSRNAVIVVILFGLVSLFADIVYEGARGVIPSYLGLLGAGSFIIGTVTGLGEFLGYGLRLVFGRFADTTRKYWLFTTVGYVVNLIAVPLLAFTGRWEVAAFLILIERLGKAVRTPARDVLISSAVSSMGRGKGFGLHETLDQVGGLIGPLLAFATLYITNSYPTFFLTLLVPAMLALATLYITYRVYPRSVEPLGRRAEMHGRISKSFWIYLAAVSLSVCGFMTAPLVLYRADESGLMPEPYVPMLYFLAMGVDGLLALPSGLLYDRYGLKILALCFALAPLIPITSFNGGLTGLILAAIILGVVLSMHETIMRAAVADLSEMAVRGTAYGIFNTAYGFSWLIAGSTIGYLYRFGGVWVFMYSALLQLPAIVLISTLSGTSGSR